MWPVDLLFIQTSPVKQYSYENDFVGVFGALHQSFLVLFLKWSSYVDMYFSSTIVVTYYVNV